MTLILKFDLDIVKMYLHTKNEVSMLRGSKVIAWIDRNTDTQTQRQTDRQTDTQTDRQTHRQTDMTENITYPHTQVVTIYGVWVIYFFSCSYNQSPPWSMCGRYASYWNVFLFSFIFMQFFGTIWPNNRFASPPLGFAPISGKSSISHQVVICNQTKERIHSRPNVS